MEWLASNWLWVALVAGFIALHWFGHGRHGHGGGHGHHSRSAEGRDPKSSPVTGAELSPAAGATAHAGRTDAPTPDQSKRHRHGC